MNSIHCIKPYKIHNSQIWAFSDPSRGLVDEPFCGSANAVIDQLTKDIKNAGKGFLLFFSSEPLPGAHLMLTRVDVAGNLSGTYYKTKTEQIIWLCSSLNRFYPESPEYLYAYAEEAKS